MSKFLSVIGKKFGYLTVENEFKEDGRWKVACICDCGVKCIKMRSHVLSGGTKSCGCQQAKIGKAQKNWKGYGQISGDYWSSLQRNAKARGFVFDVDIGYAWDLFVKQESRCAISGEPIGFVLNRRKNYANQTASLDRIDSGKGYVSGNVWWVHKKINQLKSDCFLPEFVSWCKKIAQHHIRGKDYRKWDLRFLNLAKHISSWSKDPSTRVGAVIFDSQHRIVSMGFNGLPAGVADVGLEDRDRKYKTIIHAEMNSILFAQRNLNGCTLATWPFMPCSNCSSAVIQAGIVRCIFPKAEGDKAARWADSFRLSIDQFEQAGVLLEEYEMNE